MIKLKACKIYIKHLIPQHFLFGAVVYSVFAFIFFGGYKYQINPDGISYVNIASLYLDGDFENSINGYWSPLLSWLMLPFLWLNIEPLIAARLTLLLIGYFALFQMGRFFENLSISKYGIFVGQGVSAIVLTSYAYTVITPDLLFVAISLMLVNNLYILKESRDLYSAIWCGAIGGLLFLTKAFGLPFFLCLLTISTIVDSRRLGEHKNMREITRSYFVALFSASIVVAPWISLINYKYGVLTIGTAGAYNHAILGPSAHGHPMHYLGLLQPPYGAATSIWDDISSLQVKNWYVFDSLETFIWQLKIFAKNVALIAHGLSAFSVFGLPVVGFCLYLVIKKSLPKSLDVPLTAVVCVIVGYGLLVVERRYLWLCALLILGLGISLLLNTFVIEKEAGFMRRKLLCFAFCLSFLAYPIKLLAANYNAGLEIFNSSRLINNFELSGRVASNANWYDTLYLSFYSRLSYFGENGQLSTVELIHSLKDNKIDFYFLWEQGPDHLEALKNCRKISDGDVNGLKIYDVSACY